MKTFKMNLNIFSQNQENQNNWKNSIQLKWNSNNQKLKMKTSVQKARKIPLNKVFINT
jgi:hypothetical protein